MNKRKKNKKKFTFMIPECRSRSKRIGFDLITRRTHVLHSGQYLGC